jgi:hypothetical protein
LLIAELPINYVVGIGVKTKRLIGEGVFKGQKLILFRADDT